MNAKSRMAAVLIGALLSSPVASLGAQTAESLGTVRLPQSVMANGQVLPAGTYTARLSKEPVTRVVGQADDSSRWVEFVANGQARGRELATVIPPPDVKEVAKGTPPAQGTARVQRITGGEYLRVWFNRAGTQYLLHFQVAK